MGLREKVALIIAFITLIQITFVSCSSRDKTPMKNVKQVRAEPTKHSPKMVSLKPQKKFIKTRSRVPDKNQQTIYKTFNFPDVEYPTATSPRPPFHLRETNTMQRNPVQRAAEYPTSSTAQYPLKENRKHNKKYNTKLTHLRTTKKPGTSINYPDASTTPKPYYIREEGIFPDVEYPLSAKDMWKPNYWKPIPNGEFQNQVVQKSVSENISKTGTNSRSNTAIINSVSQSDSKKTDPKNTQQVKTSSSTNNSPNKVNINQSGKEKTGKNSVIMIDINLPARKTNKANEQSTTPSPNQSVCTKSTTPFVLTPYTTIYFDKTSPNDDKITSKDENKSVKRKTKKRRKKKGKKEDSTRPKKTTDIKIHITPSRPEQKNCKNVTLTESNSKVNVSKSDTCTYMSNDKLTSPYLVTTPSYVDNINHTTVSQVTTHNDDEMPNTSSDKKVASISDAINASIPNNGDKDTSCIEDNVINSNNSSTCVDNSNDSPLSPRESDEEFTTDVFPDFDENMSPVFTVSTSTMSPLSSIEEAWAKSEVIDPYKSLSYPDELEEMYILVK